MNINRKLKKINKDLQEVALEMETSADKPRERKGDYVRLYGAKGLYRDRNLPAGSGLKYFVAQLVTKPEFNDDMGSWEAKVIYEANEDGTKFSKSIAYWDPEYGGIWMLDMSIKSRNDKMPSKWNPDIIVW